MTRTILILIVVGAFLCVVAGPGCAQGGVGDPCIPEQEYDTCFPGFDEQEVNVESKSFQCLTRTCLVNHFQGRVSCPYGQNANMMTKLPACGNAVGGPPITPYYPGTGTTTCSIPGGASVLGDSGALMNAYQIQVPVLPQITPRQASNTVYCSCRCANVDGATDDGDIYCQCPDGYVCTQLVTSIGSSTLQGLTGGYCIKNSTAFNPANLSGQQPCAPGTNPCSQPE